MGHYIQKLTPEMPIETTVRITLTTATHAHPAQGMSAAAAAPSNQAKPSSDMTSDQDRGDIPSTQGTLSARANPAAHTVGAKVFPHVGLKITKTTDGTVRVSSPKIIHKVLEEYGLAE